MPKAVYIQRHKSGKTALPDGSGFFVGTVPTSEERLELYYKAFDLVARAWEGRFRKQAQDLFKQELEAILAILRKEGKQEAVGAFLGFLNTVVAFLVTARANWQTSFLPLFAGLVESQAEEVLGALGFSFDVTSPEAMQFLETYTIRFADEIASTTEAGVRGLVAQAQAEGWSVPRLREEIMAQYAEFEQQRAEVIARTETIRSSNAGTQEAWRLAGIERTQWYASIDGRQCVWCEWMHNQYGPGTNGISISENYVNLGDEISVQTEGGTKTMTVTYGNVGYPPLHPNCRCTILAVTE